MAEKKQEKCEEKWSFAKPPRIPQKNIREVIDTDVVVAGFGVSGACAALSARLAGARVILLEKGPTWNARGRGNSGFNSRLRPAPGDVVEARNEVVAEVMRWGGYRAEQRLVNLWADNSGAVMNWLLDLAQEQGIYVEARQAPPVSKQAQGHIKTFPYDHLFHPDGEKTMLRMLEKKIKESGVDIRFETPAVRLVRTGKGRVTGIIARNKAGYYQQFNARAVILCTGGFETSDEMKAKYAPRALFAPSIAYETEFNTGDGHKMGLWVGAAMDEAPQCVQYEDGGGPHLEGPLRYGIGLARQPWLNVNVNGERYVNEDLVWTLIASADLSQPQHAKWAIWDEKWRDDAKVEKMGSAHSIYSVFHGTTPELTEEKIRTGAVLKEDTLEALARRMEVPWETFKATVTRYNELVRIGKDVDFGKDPAKLKPIDKPPFYAARMGAAILVTLGGLKINTRIQVLDTDYKVIPGLYAAGNTSGGFFANDYPQNVPGLTHGRAFTFGRLAGLNAAAERLQV